MNYFQDYPTKITLMIMPFLLNITLILQIKIEKVQLLYITLFDLLKF